MKLILEYNVFKHLSIHYHIYRKIVLGKNLDLNKKTGFDIDFSSLAHTYIRVIAMFFTASIAGFFFFLLSIIQRYKKIEIHKFFGK